MTEASDCAQIVGTKFWNSRPVEEPQTEALIRGPRDGFTEDFRTNTALVRRRLRDPNLRFETFQLGRRSRTDVAVVYVEGIVNDKLLQEVRRRIHTIDVDEVAGSGFIEQWLTDHQLSPFPQIMSTERPDKLSAALLQGKVGIIVDNSPFQLIMPMTLFAFFHSPEDYYQNWIVSTAIRVMRFGAAFLATFMPAFYIALTEFHHGMLPSELAFSIAGSREGVPFPSVVEAFAMEATLELLREAGIRLPKPIGQTIGIVGGLVIGEAAVRAGIVSPIMVIVVAITAISSFSLPSYTFAISLRLLRFLVMLSAALFGLYGIVLAYIMLNIHIANLKSFGIPYSTPFAPTFLSDWKDLILRAPLSMMTGRPKMMRTKDKNRSK
ncbi:spore germination protein [Cohnella rhizosphaerae]|uniref:spore germination protein n=1 Tax=Cohnella rhizosphaerae TaxID=1457232 RepID=UPI0030B909EC